LSLDWTSFTVVAAPDPSSKCNEELLLDWFGGVKEVWVSAGIGAELEPGVPIFCLKLVIHCCSGNRFPPSVEITSEVVAGVRCTSCQDKFCGRGKRELKWVRNRGSGTIAAVL
jgi:hypothetical protein